MSIASMWAKHAKKGTNQENKRERDDVTPELEPDHDEEMPAPKRSRKTVVLDDDDDDSDDDAGSMQTTVVTKTMTSTTTSSSTSDGSSSSSSSSTTVMVVENLGDASSSAHQQSSANAGAVTNTRKQVEDEDEGVDDAESDGEEESDEEESDEELEEEESSADAEKKAKKARLQAGKVKAEAVMNRRYHPVKDAGWKRGEPVPFVVVSRVFAQIDALTSRHAIVRLMRDLLRSVLILTPEDLLPVLYLAVNKIAPAYENLELGIGESILIKALQAATGTSVSKIKRLLEEHGDLGTIAKQSRSSQRTLFKPAALTARKVFKTFKSIASTSGASSQEKKKQLIVGLLVACKEDESMYIVRSLKGDLRIGLQFPSALVALAQAVAMTPLGGGQEYELHDVPVDVSRDQEMNAEEAAQLVRTVFSELPSLDLIVPQMVKHGLSGLREACKLTPGIPVHPMLAKPTKGVAEVLTRLRVKDDEEKIKAFTCEYKYDGQRAQVHVMSDGTVGIYSRNSENQTGMYPDVIAMLPEAANSGTRNYILDAEVVAYDKENGILPFQVLSTRGRKDVDIKDVKVQVALYAFDLLYLNDESYIQRSLRERRTALHEAFTAVEGKFMFASYKDTDDVDVMQEFLDEAVKEHTEGLMVKTLDEDATYEPSRRSFNWLKVKKDYLEGLGDSMDLVPIGGYMGRGKRTGVYGGYLLACYDEDTETYQTVCKIGTGFSDEALQEHTEFLKQHVVSKQPSYYRVHERLTPDVWFDPVQVWEVLAADLSVSPVHTAAVTQVHESKGVAMRFPRFQRIRDDKKPQQATTSDQVADMYRAQKLNTTGVESGGPGGAGEFW